MSPLRGLVIMNFKKSINMPSLAGLVMVTTFLNSLNTQPRSDDMFIEKKYIDCFELRRACPAPAGSDMWNHFGRISLGIHYYEEL